MSDRLDALVARESRVYLQSARRWPLALARGEGSRVWDLDGREYVDLTAGWGVTAIGHSHPALVEAIRDQAATLIQTTNIVFSEAQVDLAEALDRITPDPIHRSFFVSSGAERRDARASSRRSEASTGGPWGSWECSGRRSTGRAGARWCGRARSSRSATSTPPARRSAPTSRPSSSSRCRGKGG